MTGLKRFGVVVGCLLVLGVIYQQWAERRDNARFPAPGRMIAVGEHRLHLWCTGHGHPIVMLLSGDGTPSVTMYAAQSRIATFTTACSYDRAGLGWSDPPPRPMGLVEQVRDLQHIVRNGGLTGPFVLVPESGGTLIALSFFERSPGSVAGMVSVDGSEPDLWFRGSPDEFPSMRLMDPVWQAGWHLGVVRLMLPFAVPPWVQSLPPRLRRQFDTVWSRAMPSYARDAIDRWEQTAVADRPTITAGAWGRRPIILLRHGLPGGMGVPKRYEAEWPAAQAKLATLSADSTTIIAKDNHHPIAEENPALVSDQVRRIVTTLRAQASSSTPPPPPARPSTAAPDTSP
ncbi:MAG: alpha/beta hydrolase [Sphingomonas taxi]